MFISLVCSRHWPMVLCNEEWVCKWAMPLALFSTGKAPESKEEPKIPAEENCGSHPDQEIHTEHEPEQQHPPTHDLEPHPLA